VIASPAMRSMFPALLGAVSACGPLDSVTVEVTTDAPAVIAHVDQVRLVGDPEVYYGAQSAPIVFPVRFTILHDDVASEVDTAGVLCLHASALWNDAEVALSYATDFFDDCIDFEDSPVQIALSAVPLDVLRHCEDDDDCATGSCGPPGFAPSLTFCTAPCASDDDCPTASRCTAKYGSDEAKTCVPECSTGGDCVPPGPIASPTWRCDVDDDGLCGFL
jgi:hypothetical protein